MSATILDAQTVRTMFLAAAANLERNKAWINDLNVFPVPDGDTAKIPTAEIRQKAKDITPDAEKGDTSGTPEKKSFWKRLFGK